MMLMLTAYHLQIPEDHVSFIVHKMMKTKVQWETRTTLIESSQYPLHTQVQRDATCKIVVVNSHHSGVWLRLMIQYT